MIGVGVLGRVPSGQRKIAHAELCQDLDSSRRRRRSSSMHVFQQQRSRHGRVRRRVTVPSNPGTHHMPLSAGIAREVVQVTHRATAHRQTVARSRRRTEMNLL